MKDKLIVPTFTEFVMINEDLKMRQNREVDYIECKVGYINIKETGHEADPSYEGNVEVTVDGDIYEGTFVIGTGDNWEYEFMDQVSWIYREILNVEVPHEDFIYESFWGGEAATYVGGDSSVWFKISKDGSRIFDIRDEEMAQGMN